MKTSHAGLLLQKAFSMPTLSIYEGALQDLWSHYGASIRMLVVHAKLLPTIVLAYILCLVFVTHCRHSTASLCPYGRYPPAAHLLLMLQSYITIHTYLMTQL